MKDLTECSKYELNELLEKHKINYDFSNQSRMNRISTLLENNITHAETAIVYPENSKNASTQTILNELEITNNISYITNGSDANYHNLKVRDYLETKTLNVGGKLFDNGIYVYHAETEQLNVSLRGNIRIITSISVNLVTSEMLSEKGVIIVENDVYITFTAASRSFNLKPGISSFQYIVLSDKLYIHQDSTNENAAIETLTTFPQDVAHNDEIIEISHEYFAKNKNINVYSQNVNLDEKSKRHIITIDQPLCYVHGTPSTTGQIVLIVNTETKIEFENSWNINKTHFDQGTHIINYIMYHNNVYSYVQ